MKSLPFSICIVLFCLITGLSCTKNNTPPTPPGPQVKKASQWSKEGNLLKVSATIYASNVESDTWKWTTYEYDTKFNLVKTTDSIQDLSKEGFIIEGKPAAQATVRQYQYIGNTLVKVVYLDSLFPATSLIYNAQGQLVSAFNTQTKYSFNYSNNGDTVDDTLVFNNGIKDIYILNRYFFQNGNMVKSQQFDITGGNFRQTINIDYGSYDQKNTPLKALPQTNIVRLFFTSETEAWKNNVLSFDYTDVLNGSQASRTYAYEYNTAGYPTKTTPSDGFTNSKYFYYTNP